MTRDSIQIPSKNPGMNYKKVKAEVKPQHWQDIVHKKEQKEKIVR